jgi:hypothetical protein
MASRSRCMTRELCGRRCPSRRGSRECRVRAAPAVSCAKCAKESAHEHTGSAEAVRHSLRNGFNAYIVLPGYRACLTPSSREYGFVRPVGFAKPPRDLTPTAEASGPYDFAVRCGAVRLRAQAIAHGSIKPALRFRLRAGTAASIAPRPNVRDDGQRPSEWDGMANHIV